MSGLGLLVKCNSYLFLMLLLGQQHLPKRVGTKGDRTRSRAPSFLHDVMQSRSAAFSVGEGWIALSMHPEEYPPRKDYERIACKSLYSTTCLY